MENSEPRLRLTIKLDTDELGWTHLHGPFGTTVALQDLPPPLRALLSGFIHVLREGGAQRFHFEEHGATTVVTPEGVRDLPILLGRRTRSSVRRGLLLTTWWIEFTRLRGVGLARAALGIVGDHAQWRCLDCGALSAPEKEHCGDPHCSSWDKLHACTGDAIMRAMPHTA